MNSLGKIYGVSLGPGVPELITVKGLNILKKVDKIYYPGSIEADGNTSSYSLKILEYYSIKKEKLSGMFLTMSDNRESTEKTYYETFCKIKADYDAGMQIAFVSEGDISFYSTFAYLLKHIHEHKLNVEIVAGVPSFLLGAAVFQTPLAILNEKIAILPRMRDAVQLQKYLNDFDTVVLIKIRSVIQEIIEVVISNSLNIVYCERLGTDQQFVTSDIHQLKGRNIPYFSLLIIKK